MRWIVLVVAALAVVVGTVWVLGRILPVAHSATASRVVEGTPDEVWVAVTDVDGFAGWRPGLDGAERLPDRGGLPAWREWGATGDMTMEVVEWSPPHRMVTRIADEGLPFGGTWTYELAAVDSGTRVTLTEDGEIYNPFFRFMSRFVFGYDGTMRSYLDGLEARMAEGGR